MKISSFVISIALTTLITACGSDNDDSSPVLDVSSPPQREEDIQTDWTSLRSKFIYSEVNENGCNSESVLINRDGSFTTNNCGDVKKGALTAEQLATLDSQIDLIMSQFGKRLACSDDATQDASWDYHLKTNKGSTKRVFFNDGSKECRRGEDITNTANPEGMYLKLDELVNSFTNDGDQVIQ